MINPDVELIESPLGKLPFNTEYNIELSTVDGVACNCMDTGTSATNGEPASGPAAVTQVGLAIIHPILLELVRSDEYDLLGRYDRR